MATQTAYPDSGLSGAVVLITGALTGIGRATALAFAKEGSRIVVSGRRQKEGADFATELQAMGVEAEFIYADVRQEKDLESLIQRTVGKFGRLDIAVNNAATEGKPGPIDTGMFDRFAGSPESKERTKAKLPVQRLGKAEEVANTIVYIGSNSAPFLTGQSIVVDGGRSL